MKDRSGSIAGSDLSHRARKWADSPRKRSEIFFGTLSSLFLAFNLAHYSMLYSGIGCSRVTVYGCRPRGWARNIEEKKN